ncbi:MAG: Holliday junction branch migration protein RuvA [candidate division WOR-3 bacterium]
MIGRLSGILKEKEPTRVVIDCSGIGFEVHVPLSTSSRLPEPGQETELLIAMDITREGVSLFGFFEEAERRMFRLITSVRGVGPKAALNLLSRLSPDEIGGVIARRDVAVLRTVPGIGPKKIERLLAELEPVTREVSAASSMISDGIAALVSLGLTRKEAVERLGRVKITPGMTLQELLRITLAQPR